MYQGFYCLDLRTGIELVLPQEVFSSEQAARGDKDQTLEVLGKLCTGRWHQTGHTQGSFPQVGCKTTEAMGMLKPEERSGWGHTCLQVSLQYVTQLVLNSAALFLLYAANICSRDS